MDLLLAKIVGSIAGSSIAVVFQPGGDTKRRLINRFIIGTVLGFIFAPFVIDYLNWQHTFDYWLASATLSGLFGVLAMQFIFNLDFNKLIRIGNDK